MADLFVYGTLRDEELVFSLTRRRFDQAAALLPDFERITPAADYPYIVPRRGGCVDGLVLFAIDTSLARLDAYEDEGNLYRREEVVVRCRGGELHCFAYVGVGRSAKR